MAKSKADLLREIYSDDFMQGYVECLFFTEDDNLADQFEEEYLGGLEEDEEADVPDVEASVEDFSVLSLNKIIKDCKEFKAECKKAGLDLKKWGESQAGHDFWLTRNGHGAGFWDRGRKDGDALTEIAKSFGGVDVICYSGALSYE